MTKLKDLPDAHDLTHLEVALRYVKHFRTAVDGGAHRGIWTRAMAFRFSWVFAFEPVPSNADRIPPLTNVTTRVMALGRHAEHIAMAPGPENTGQWHRVLIGKPGSNALLARTRPLDCFHLTDVDFLKLDVEGMEAEALAGAWKTIARCRPVVLIEENGLCAKQHIRVGTAGRLLRRWGYKRVKRINKDEVWIPE